MRETITPDTVAAIMKAADTLRPSYKLNHQMNMGHPQISQCKLGAVFLNQAGDWCVYTGLYPNNRKYPVMYTRVSDRKNFKSTLAILPKIIKASA